MRIAPTLPSPCLQGEEQAVWFLKTGMIMAAPLKITICQGPSCTSRGGPTLEQVILEYAKSYGIVVEIAYRPCANQCSYGPHVIFNGNNCSSVRAADIPYFLKKYSGPEYSK